METKTMKEWRGDVIYCPTGKAKEYAEFACNLFVGCPNQCTYCYAPGALHISRSDFKSEAVPRPRILERLAKDAVKLNAWWGPDREDRPEVMFCFTCDPYPTAELIRTITGPAMDLLNSQRMNIATLTKRPMLALDILGNLKLRAEVNFGVTLTTMDNEVASYCEPFAELPSTRVLALEHAKSLGLKTFVSLEPALHAPDGLAVIEAVANCADEIRIGPINHDAAAFARVNWPRFYADAVALCDKLGVKMVAKKALLRAAGCGDRM
jgi:DNA repair photolyase